MEKTLVILAAGLGSRFGGLKQITPIGENGEFIIDYSIYDAIRNGFKKVIFVIKEDNLEDFKNTISKRIEPFIEVDYIFQKMDNLPKNVLIKREKPLGTGHALYCAKDKIKGPFALISADDFYGSESFELVSKFLDNGEKTLGIIGYDLSSTIIDKPVKRGVIFEDNNEIKSIIECLVEKDNDKIIAKEISSNQKHSLPLNTCTSMLMFGFTKDIFPVLESKLLEFLINADLTKDEFILTSVIDYYIQNNDAKVIKTPSIWMGMSYKDDSILVKKRIKNDINNGIYPSDLWSK